MRNTETTLSVCVATLYGGVKEESSKGLVLAIHSTAPLRKSGYRVAMGKLLSTLLALGLFGCGSSPKPDAATPPLGAAPADAASQPVEETAEEKFARQQVDTVAKTCERTAECMVQFAKEQLTPEQFAEQKIGDPQILVMAAGKCEKDYSAPMSPQQVIGLRECLGVPSECNVFVECFGEALSPKQ